MEEVQDMHSRDRIVGKVAHYEERGAFTNGSFATTCPSMFGCRQKFRCCSPSPFSKHYTRLYSPDLKGRDVFSFLFIWIK